MKKLLILISMIIAFFTFEGIFQLSCVKQDSELTAPFKDYQYTYFMFINYDGNSHQEENIDELYDFIQDHAKEYDLIIDVVDNREGGTFTHYLAGDEEIIDSYFPLVKIDRRLNFNSHSESSCYSSYQEEYSTASLMVLSKMKMTIRSLNQVKANEELKSFAVITIYANDQSQFNAFKLKLIAQFSGLDFEEAGGRSINFNSKANSYSIQMSGLMTLLILVVFIILVFNKEKEILLRKMMGQSYLRIGCVLLGKVSFLSMLSILLVWAVLLVINHIPFNVYSLFLYEKLFHLWIILGIGFLIGLLLCSVYCGFYRMEKTKLIYIRKMMQLNLVILTIAGMMILINNQKAIHLIYMNLIRISDYQEYQHIFKDYNTVYGNRVGDIYDINKMKDFYQELCENGYIQVPNHSIWIENGDASMAVLLSNYNYVNKMNYKDEKGNLIVIEQDQPKSVLADSSLKNYDLTVLIPEITENHPIYYIDDFKVNGSSLWTMNEFETVRSNLNVLIVDTVNSTQFAQIPSNSNYFKESEQELNNKYKQLGINLAAVVIPVKDLIDSRIDNCVQAIIEALKPLLIQLMLFILLTYQYLKLYCLIYRKEIIVRNNMGQCVMTIHQNLIFNYFVMMLPVVFVILQFYQEFVIKVFLIALFLGIYLIGLISCFIKGKSLRRFVD